MPAEQGTHFSQEGDPHRLPGERAANKKAGLSPGFFKSYHA
jgi:hypothetical protein